RWRDRVLLTIESTVVLAATILLTSSASLFRAWQASPVSAHAATVRVEPNGLVLVTLMLIALGSVRRWSYPRWLPLVGVCSLPLLWVVQSAFQLHPFQELFYSRLCWPGLLLGVSAVLPRRNWHWSLAVAAAVTIALQIPALQYLSMRTTEQEEYAFLQRVLPT